MDTCLPLRTLALLLGLIALPTANAADPVVRIDQTAASSTITHLSWDTEGGARADRNLLREPITAVRAQSDQTGGFSLTTATGNLRLPFNPVVASTSIIPARWHEDGTFELPAILNAPDFGPLVVTQVEGPAFRGRFEGDRKLKRAEILLTASGPATLQFKPLLLPAPEGEKILLRATPFLHKDGTRSGATVSLIKISSQQASEV
jgi:hypothetical protein